MAEALDVLVPRIVPGHTHRVYRHQGKQDLLTKLESRLRSYAAIAIKQPDMRVVVIVDRDDEDCVALKNRLVSTCTRARCDALCRIAIEELEAWFFGDMHALETAYPRVPKNLTRKASYRDPDAISGGTGEALERVLKRAGYYQAGMPKIEVARKVAQHMQPAANRSRSFQVFRDGLIALVAQPNRQQRS